MTDKIFEEFAEKFFKQYLDLNQLLGSHLGLHEYDGKIGPSGYTVKICQLKMLKIFL